MAEKRKMAFYEIHNGKLAVKMQEAFENCQAITQERGLPAEVTLKIKIIPSTDREQRFGNVQYFISERHPAQASNKLTTELQDGLIIADGSSAIDILQEELEFPEEIKLHKIKGVK